VILPGPVRTTVKSPTNLTGEDVAGTFLLVVSRDAYATYDLPATGTLTIGRGETNVVRTGPGSITTLGAGSQPGVCTT